MIDRLRYLPTYLAIMLAVFFSAFYLPLPSKIVNNIFYAGIIPAILIWFFRRPQEFSFFLAKFKWTLICLALLVGVQLIAPHEAKRLFYLAMLLGGCFILERSFQGIRWSYGFFAALGLLLFIYISAHSFFYHSPHGLPRADKLWGYPINPVHVGLLITSSLVFLWLFGVEPLLPNDWRVKTIGLLCLSSLALLCSLVFQARSALLGFFVFLCAYMFMRKMSLMGLVIGVIFCTLYWFDVLTPLAERGMSYRPEIWLDAIQRLSQECNFWFGCGPDGHRFSGQFFHTHSAYIALLYKGGAAACLVAFIGGAALFRYGWLTNSRWLLLALVGWGGLLTSSSGVFTTPQPLWVYFWVPTLMTVIDIQRRTIQLPNEKNPYTNTR